MYKSIIEHHSDLLRTGGALEPPGPRSVNMLQPLFVRRSRGACTAACFHQFHCSDNVRCTYVRVEHDAEGYSAMHVCVDLYHSLPDHDCQASTRQCNSSAGNRFQTTVSPCAVVGTCHYRTEVKPRRSMFETERTESSCAR